MIASDFRSKNATIYQHVGCDALIATNRLLLQDTKIDYDSITAMISGNNSLSGTIEGPLTVDGDQIEIKGTNEIGLGFSTLSNEGIVSIQSDNTNLTFYSSQSDNIPIFIDAQTNQVNISNNQSTLSGISPLSSQVNVSDYLLYSDSGLSNVMLIDYTPAPFSFQILKFGRCIIASITSGQIFSFSEFAQLFYIGILTTHFTTDPIENVTGVFDLYSKLPEYFIQVVHQPVNGKIGLQIKLPANQGLINLHGMLFIMLAE